MLKKLLLFTLCLVCVFLCGCEKEFEQVAANSNNASQAAPVGGDFKFWLSQVTCKAGETCQVEIRLAPNSQVAASDLIIEFDSTRVSYEGFKAGEVYQSDAGLQEGGNTVKVTSITLNPPAQETVMGTLTFKVKEGATGVVDLKLTSQTCANIDMVDMTPVCLKGSITIG